MTRDEVSRALRQLQVETGSLVCMGCGYEHNCSIHGCAIIRAAEREIGILVAEKADLREQCDILRERLEETRRAAMTPNLAIDILRNANLGGELRLAADAGIAALEKQIGG